MTRESGAEAFWGLAELADSDLPRSADVAVIGGGFSGAWIAYHLALGGARTVLLERDLRPRGESIAGIGELSSQIGENALRFTKALGHEGAFAMAGYLRAAYRELVELATSGLGLEVIEEGGWSLARCVEEAGELARSREILEAWGEPVELVRGEDVVGRAKAVGFALGLYRPGAALLDPARLLARVLAEFRKRGGVISPSSEVRALEESPDLAIRLVTERGTLDAELVVHAEGFEVVRLAPYLSNWVYPVREQVLATQPGPPILRGAYSANYRFDFWRQTPAGHVLAGGMRWCLPEMGCGETRREISPVLESRQAAFVGEAHGGLAGLRPLGSWAAIHAHTADLLPVAGPIPGRAREFVLAGHSGGGLVLPYALGRDLARAILGRPAGATPWRFFSPARFLK